MTDAERRVASREKLLHEKREREFREVDFEYLLKILTLNDRRERKQIQFLFLRQQT